MAVLEFSPTIGDRIVLALRKANMTQSQLADRLHVAPSSVSRWVSEKTPIDVPTLQKIAIITGQRRLVLDLVDLPDPEPTEPGNVVPLADRPDLGFRGPTCIPESAGQKVRPRAA